MAKKNSSILAPAMCVTAFGILGMLFAAAYSNAVPDNGGMKMLPGGLFWPDRVTFGCESSPIDNSPRGDGPVRGRAGGALVVRAKGDYMRSAIDIVPTEGVPSDLDGVAEVVVHAEPPSGSGQTMLSFSALGKSDPYYAIVAEAHGDKTIRPLIFLVVKDGWWAEALRIRTDGLVELGARGMGGSALVMHDGVGQAWKVSVKPDGTLQTERLAD